MLSAFTQIVSQYGYVAVGVGCFFEGEIAVFAGMIAVHEHAMTIHGVFLAALVATFLGDNLWFQIGRLFGRTALIRRPHYRVKVMRVEYLVDRFGAPVMIGFRFFYGLRYVTPFVLASLGIASWRFAFYDAIAVFIWAVAISVAGYYLAGVAEQALAWIKHAEIGLLSTVGAATLITLIIVMIVRWWR